MDKDADVVKTCGGRRMAFLLVLLLLLGGFATGVILMVNRSADGLTDDEVIGEWVLINSAESLRFVIESDGSFESTDWPLSLGCVAENWPQTENEIDWSNRGQLRGQWGFDALSQRSLTVRPLDACSSFELVGSPILGDETLRIQLDLAEEPTQSLVFHRE
ncbi:MAG: hypothetical protein P0Y60_03850 [Candidatus Microbacterium colombiense]|nr:MAG: hypothetical protein P0Y60_03850 [Microbacterium sp.]